MNEFKGTRGKWKITNNHLSEDGGFVMIGTDKHTWIAETKGCHVGTNNKESIANAKLIACAPDMLEMLENVVSWYGKRDFKTNELYSSNFQEPLIKEAMQLIKKATEL